jgi:predicted ATPase
LVGNWQYCGNGCRSCSPESSSLVPPAIAEAINLRFHADNRLPKQQLLDYLRHKQLLLVLDNFEHLQAGAELIFELLQECPGLRMLVTAREHLQLSSETLLVLESMALPSAAALPEGLLYSSSAGPSGGGVGCGHRSGEPARSVVGPVPGR